MLTGAGTSDLMLNALSGSALDDSVGLLSACVLSGGTVPSDNALGAATGYSSAPVGGAAHVSVSSQQSAGCDLWGAATTTALRAFNSDVCYNNVSGGVSNPAVTQQWYPEQRLTATVGSSSIDHRLLQQLSLPASLAAGHASGACFSSDGTSDISAASFTPNGLTASCADAGRSISRDVCCRRASASDATCRQGHASAGAGTAAWHDSTAGFAGPGRACQVQHRGRSMSNDTLFCSDDQRCNSSGCFSKASSNGSDQVMHYGLATECAAGRVTHGWNPKAAPAFAAGSNTLAAAQDARHWMLAEGPGRAAAGGGAGAGTGVFIPPALRPQTTGTGCFLPAAVRAAATAPKPTR
eukprot:gene13401-13529_t